MMLFTTDMKPLALIKNNGTPKEFTCDFCGSVGEGVIVEPKDATRPKSTRTRH